MVAFFGPTYMSSPPPPPPQRPGVEDPNDNSVRWSMRRPMQPPRGKEPDPDGGQDIPRDGLDKPFFPKVEFEDEK